MNTSISTVNSLDLDKRDFNRINNIEKALIKCLWPPFDVVNAETINVSANGLSISTKKPLALNQAVQLSVCSSKDHHVFFMTGKIAWCKKLAVDQGEPEEYSAGIEIQFERSNRDYHYWRALFLA